MLTKTELLTAQADFGPLNHYFAQRSLSDLLDWGLATFGEKLVQVTSFGPTGMVILDQLVKLNPGQRIITVDTGFLFDETYALLAEIQGRYPIQLDIHRPGLTPKIQGQLYGPQLWTYNPDLCCHLRKVEPLQNALHDADAWLTGLRRDQSPTRAAIPFITWDTKYKMVKVNPLANWTREEVWAYIVKYNLPYNRLHDQGYASIGCTHCTHPTRKLTDERAGRWQGTAKIECGIHLSNG